MSELIWITGASQGIGRALALAYARRGAAVVISARNRDRLQKVVQEGADLPGRLLPLPCDVTDRDQVASAVELLIEQERLPDRIILNAGTHQPMPAHRFSAATVQHLLNINLMGVAVPLEQLLPLLLQRQQGQVAIVASVAGYRGLPTASAYGASKAGLINLAESLRAELLSSGVDIRLINPGFVKTPLTDKNDFSMPFLISAEQAAERIIRGLSGSAFEIVFPARMAWVMSVLKWLPDRLFFSLIHRGTGHGR